MFGDCGGGISMCSCLSWFAGWACAAVVQDEFVVVGTCWVSLASFCAGLFHVSAEGAHETVGGYVFPCRVFCSCLECQGGFWRGFLSREGGAHGAGVVVGVESGLVMEACWVEAA